MLKPSPQRTVPSSNVTFYLMSYLSPLGFLENLAYRNYNTLFTYWMLQRTPVLGQVPPPEEEDRSPALGALSLEGEIEYGHRWWWELPAVLCAVREGQSWCWQKPTYNQRAQRCPVAGASSSHVLKDGQDLSMKKQNRWIPGKKRGINEAYG